MEIGIHERRRCAMRRLQSQVIAARDVRKTCAPARMESRKGLESPFAPILGREMHGRTASGRDRVTWGSRGLHSPGDEKTLDGSRKIDFVTPLQTHGRNQPDLCPVESSLGAGTALALIRGD